MSFCQAGSDEVSCPSGAEGVLVVIDDVPSVRWSPTAGAAVPLADYLDDRVGLLVDPPRGATD